MMSKKNIERDGGEKGLTLIELVISLTVFLIGIAAIYGVTRLATIEKNTINTRTDQMRSARIALEYIRRDTLNAGFGYHRTGGNIPDNLANGLFKIAADADAERDILTSVLAGNNINTNDLAFGVKTDVIGLISRDPTFNLDAVNKTPQLINYTSSSANGNIVEVKNTTNNFANCNQYDLYLFESSTLGTTQVVGLVTTKVNNNTLQLATGAADPLGINQPATGNVNTQNLLVTTAGGGTIKRINMVSYSVTSAGVLVRKKFGNQTGSTAAQQIETRELVYGVSDFQIKYYMEDGTTVDDPSLSNNGRTNQMKMNSVVQVQISITLAPSATDSQPMMKTPITLKEFISTKNLRYEAS